MFLKDNNNLFHKSPARVAAVSFVFLAGVLGFWLVFFTDNRSLFPLMGMAFLFAIGVWRARAWPFYGLVAVVFGYKFFDWNWNLVSVNSVNVGDLVFPIALLGFLICCFRFLELTGMRRAFPDRQVHDGGRRSVWGERDVPIAYGRWILVPIAVAIAVIFLGVIDYNPAISRQFWMTQLAMRMTMMVITLFFFWLTGRGLFSLARRWKINQAQASVYFRSNFAKEVWREQSAIERRRALACIQDPVLQEVLDVDGERKNGSPGRNRPIRRNSHHA